MNEIKIPDFFGIAFKHHLPMEDVFTDDLRKSASTPNPTIIPEIELVYVLSGRSTALGADADGLQRPFDAFDDLERIREGIVYDLQGEYSAMQRYSGGDKPSIARQQSKNTFFNDVDLHVIKSFERAKFWDSRMPGLFSAKQGVSVEKKQPEEEGAHISIAASSV